MNRNDDCILLPFGRDGDGCGELLAEAGAANTFCTTGYARAMQALGREVWIVGLHGAAGESRIALACIARGRLSVELEIPSMPAAAQDPRFWQVVQQLCRKVGATDLYAGSFGSPPFELPPLPGEISRKIRQELVLRLRDTDLAALLNPKHRRELKKAEAAGLALRRTRTELAWVSEHAAMIRHSMQRRIDRGEDVSDDVDPRTFCALLENGAAELFQTTMGDSVLSSAVLLLAPRTAYYYSAGNSPAGLNLGASHFLLHNASCILQQEGRETFNLGGADEESTLARFKLRFGAEPVHTPAATCYCGPEWKRMVRNAVHRLRAE